jgi:hypothetical protein
MSSSNSWAEFAGVFCRTRAAHLDHDAAKAELKKLMPEDAKEAIGIALKAAETDATKRALATFGKPFGLDLYRGGNRIPEAAPALTAHPGSCRSPRGFSTRWYAPYSSAVSLRCPNPPVAEASEAKWCRRWRRPKDEKAKPPNLIETSAEFAANFVPPDYLIDGLIQTRFVYSMAGATGAGKTCVATRWGQPPIVPIAKERTIPFGVAFAT